MCDLNKNPNLNKINHKNKSFNSFITNKYSSAVTKKVKKFDSLNVKKSKIVVFVVFSKTLQRL